VSKVVLPRRSLKNIHKQIRAEVEMNQQKSPKWEEAMRGNVCPDCGRLLHTRIRYIKGGRKIPIDKICYYCNVVFPLLRYKEEKQMDEREKALGINLLGSIKALIREELAAREDRDTEPLSEFDNRSGHKWSSEEETMLIHEMKSFLHQAAATHRRTVNAIGLRVEELYKRGRFCDIDRG